jgi:hypothetical protein
VHSTFAVGVYHGGPRLPEFLKSQYVETCINVFLFFFIKTVRYSQKSVSGDFEV